MGYYFVVKGMRFYLKAVNLLIFCHHRNTMVAYLLIYMSGNDVPLETTGN